MLTGKIAVDFGNVRIRVYFTVLALILLLLLFNKLRHKNTVAVVVLLLFFYYLKSKFTASLKFPHDGELTSDGSVLVVRRGQVLSNRSFCISVSCL